MSRTSEEILVDRNSQLVTELSDCQQQLRESHEIIESLRRDVKSYEVSAALYLHKCAACSMSALCSYYQLLQQSQPSYMYTEVSVKLFLWQRGQRTDSYWFQLMAQSRISLQEENQRLRDEVYLLKVSLCKLH